MSQSTTNNAYVTKSMNGIISYDDGAGGSMEGGVITCNELATTNLRADSLQAFTSGASCNLYTNVSGGASNIHIGNSAITLFVDSGIASVSPIYCSELHAANIYASTSINTTFLDTPFTTDTPYLWPFTTGAITIGSATTPIIGNYVCTANNHLANKQYVDSMLSSTLIGNTITSTNVSATTNIYSNLTTGSINIGTGLTTGTLTLGGTAESGDIVLRTTGTLNLGVSASAINLGTTASTSNIIQTANSSTISLNLGNTMTTGAINMGGALTTGSINVGRDAMTGSVNIRGGGIMNLGSSTTTLNVNAPILPTYAYNASTGITPTTGIGYFYTGTITTNIQILGTQTTLLNIQIADTGVYMINVNLVLVNQSLVVQTGDRIRTYLGWGVINNNSNNIFQINHNNFKWGTTIATGVTQTLSFTYIYSITAITSPNNYICLSSTFTGTSIAVNTNGTVVQVVRMA